MNVRGDIQGDVGKSTGDVERTWEMHRGTKVLYGGSKRDNVGCAGGCRGY